MKRHYLVKFYAGTDLRAESIVSAYDDLKALSAALAEQDINEWVIADNFKIVIQIVIHYT